MKAWIFARRNAKEILRDPLNLAFGIGFPVIVLLLLSAIQANIPVSLFEIDRLAPGITVFGLSFITLFSATVVARDRTTSLLSRLYTTPMTAGGFIAGYTLPMLPICLAQCLLCFLVALPLGLTPTPRILLAAAAILAPALFYVALGLLCGSLFNDRQVGGICGALLTNLSAWLSGIWFDLELVGGAFQKIAYALPFVHAVELERAVFSGQTDGIGTHLLWVLGYAAVTAAAAVLAFLHQMKKQ